MITETQQDAVDTRSWAQSDYANRALLVHSSRATLTDLPAEVYLRDVLGAAEDDDATHESKIRDIDNFLDVSRSTARQSTAQTTYM